MRLQAIPTMLTMIPSLFRGVGPRDLERIMIMIRQAYPAVPQLNTERASQWFQEDQCSSVLLVDVRAPHEFAVSHLRGAVNLREPAEIIRMATEQKSAEMVLYCSVGFRSSRLADRLLQQGAGGVYNLEGSIFQWANEGRPVYQGDKIVQQIHPYGKRWAGMLKSGAASGY